MVLVTGASGFLGRRLIRHLAARGEQVRALYRSYLPGDLSGLPGITWRSCDLLDVFDVAEVMEGISEVYHCAAIVSYDPARRHELLHFNPESTANIINQSLEQGIRKLVYISSIAALGRSNTGKEITEEEEWGESRYNSAYGISKYLAETEVWRGIGEGLDAVVLNPGIMLGRCEDRDQPASLLRLARSGFPFYTQGVTSWVDVDDVVRSATLLMESDITAERFIVSCGNYSYHEIMCELAALLGKKPPHIYAGPLLTAFAWRWHRLKSRFSGVPSTLSKEAAANARITSLYNNKKLLSFIPGFTYVPVKQSIALMTTAQ